MPRQRKRELLKFEAELEEVLRIAEPLIGTEHVKRLKEERERKRAVAIAFAGPSRAGKSLTAKALVGHVAAIESTSGATTNVPASYLCQHDKDDYEAVISVSDPEEFAADVKASVGECLRSKSGKHHKREKKFLENVFGPHTDEVLKEAARAGADAQRITALIQDTKAYKLAAAGPPTRQIGPMSREPLLRELYPYLHSQRGSGRQQVQNAWMVCQDVDMIGPCTAKEMHNVRVKDFPGLRDFDKLRIQRAKACKKEEFKLLVVDAEQHEAVTDLVQDFLKLHLTASYLPGESKLVISYNYTDRWGDEVYMQFANDDSVRQMEVELQRLQDQAKGIRDQLEELQAGVKTRSATDTEKQIGELKHELEEAEEKTAAKQHARHVLCRKLMRESINEEVQRWAAEIAAAENLPPPPKIPVVFPSPKEALRLEPLLKTGGQAIAKEFRDTGMPLLRSIVAARKKECELLSNVKALEEMCKQVMKRYHDLQVEQSRQKGDLEAAMQNFISRAVSSVQSDMNGACEQWCSGLDQVLDGFETTMEGCAKMAEELLKAQLEEDDEDEQPSAGEEEPQRLPQLTLNDALMDERLDALRRMASAAPNDPRLARVLKALHAPFERTLMARGWGLAFVQPLRSRLKSIEQALQQALQSSVRRVLEEYEETYHTRLQPMVKASVKNAVTGLYIRICEDVSISSLFKKAHARVYEQVATLPLLKHLQAAISDASKSHPPGGRHSKKDVVQAVLEDMNDRLEGIVPEVTDSLKQAARHLVEWIKSVMWCGSSASGSAGLSNGDGTAGGAGPSTGDGTAGSGTGLGMAANGGATFTLVDGVCAHLPDILSDMRPETVPIKRASQAMQDLLRLASRLDQVCRSTVAVYLEPPEPQPDAAGGPSGSAPVDGAAGPSSEGAAAPDESAASAPSSSGAPAPQQGGHGGAEGGDDAPSPGAAGGSGSGSAAPASAAPDEKTILRSIVEGRRERIEAAVTGVRELVALSGRDEEKQQAPQQGQEGAGQQQAAPAAQGGHQPGAGGTNGGGAGGSNSPGVQRVTRSATKRAASEARQEADGGGAAWPERGTKRLRPPTYEEWMAGQK